MEIIIKTVLLLVLINGLFFLLIAALTMENPFKLGTVLCLLVVNPLVFLLAALATSRDPGTAVVGFGARMLPLALLVVGIAAVILVQVLMPARGRGG